MARFITTFDTCCIDFDKIVCIKFTPLLSTIDRWLDKEDKNG